MDGGALYTATCTAVCIACGDLAATRILTCASPGPFKALVPEPAASGVIYSTSPLLTRDAPPAAAGRTLQTPRGVRGDGESSKRARLFS